ncbi:MAG: hypothetical protein V4590_10065 [Bacteroidota bacterium]
MKKHLTVIPFFFFYFFTMAQQPIEIGKVVKEQYVLTTDTALLRKTLQQTLADGTQINSMHIESMNQWHYLIGVGTQRNYSKTIAVELIYSMSTRTFSVKPGMAHKTCASAGCNYCEPFKENGNIIGCHCKQQGTVSNECNFKTIPLSPFYDKLKRNSGLRK